MVRGSGRRRRRGHRPFALLAPVLCLVLGAGLAAALPDGAGPDRAGHGGAGHGAGHGGPGASGRPSPGPATAEPGAEAGVAADPPPVGPQASSGSVGVDCGRGEEGHYNEDNVVVSPGLPAGAHHTHAYAGNLSTDAASTDASLAAAATSCRGGDRSTYYWPVLRRTDRPGTRPHERAAGHGNTGRILPEAAVTVEYRGSPVSRVVPMPRFLRAVTGDAVAGTARDGGGVRARWGCSGTPDRSTTRYPRCPEGERITRTLVFPSCWNGLDTDSPDHRAHLGFPAENGVCPADSFPVPQLRIGLEYEVEPGTPVAVDSFPEQRHDPRTDHAMFVNVMTDEQMAAVVDCLNRGVRCRL
jgi:hypothetical protein